jgi:hypothetical protein
LPYLKIEANIMGNQIMGSPIKKHLSFLLQVLIIFVSYIEIGYTEEPISTGRSLPGDIWQPENTKATFQSQQPVYGDSPTPFLPLTWWGEDIRLTYFAQPNAHNSVIAASEEHIYVAWWYLTGDTVFFVRSSDEGSTWTDQKLSDDSTTYAYIPEISASEGNVYVVYRGTRPYEGIYLQRSTDFGETWQSTQRLYYSARNLAEKPVVISKDNLACVVAAIEVDYVPPQDWDLWLFRSQNFGISWPDTFFVSDSIYSGIGPDVTINNGGLHLVREMTISPYTEEILYQKSTNGGETWSGLIVISDDDSIHSFWPQITAWGDSNVAISWTDYKDSPEEWTGDAFFSKSTNNGFTWTAPYQLTFSHGVTGTDIVASGDTILISYDDDRNGPAFIYANVSFDGGESWQGEIRVSDGSNYSIESSVTISNGMGHISWSDARNNPNPRYFEIYYDRSYLDNTAIGEDVKPPKPNEISIQSYPNSFNSEVIILYNLNNKKGGELAIFNIQGQLVKKFDLIGKEGKIIWDARDAMGNKVSSGIYFAKAGASQNSCTIKLLYLK